ncbi:MIND complex subunit NSL1 KNAG_0D00860 [Huiozyma naganishii CBS 8797]|uniref:Uncharacterized protein n=1 Tax=Huiozyma naganishii (strain ATCC MYA-139 / BCRC 22969 / CBS 8797 / KCTC 17520 / NBRC 10181 / NCYC 3082 / Yp74L-3) TaxID=1071383 RepID=J7RK06_HUIN7|nr:hypothetical protein KNAG_0D00860 [Kazachstania naganishii CBS 8797]CCK69838.1 hypothetical protein KNAG_0D00860 [Kazachstania naganishii CBS 8797]
MEKLYVPIEQVRSITDQMLASLEEKLSRTLPAPSGESDTVRREVQLGIQAYLDDMLNGVSSSVVIDNVDMDGRELRDIIAESQSRYLEPFDIALNERLREKYKQWEDHSIAVSRLRRDAPAHINGIYSAGMGAYLADVDRRLEELETAQEPQREPDPGEPSMPDAPQQLAESIVQLKQSLDALATVRGAQHQLQRLARTGTGSAAAAASFPTGERTAHRAPAATGN